MKSFKTAFGLSKSQKIGFIILLFLCLIAEVYMQWLWFPKEIEKTMASEDLIAMQDLIDQDSITYPSQSFNKNFPKTVINKAFNPNDLNAEQWQNLGFSPKQVEVILNYKNKILKGKFHCKEEIEKCYVINEEKYIQMAPFLQLSDNCGNFNSKNHDITDKKIFLKPFDPNAYQLEDWENLGFSYKQAQVIINYRDRNLRGNFHNLEEIKKCYVINDEKFEEIRPFIRLNIKEPNNQTAKELTTKKAIDLPKLQANDLDENGWISLGFSSKQAQSILKYRNSLGGKFTAETLKKSYVITPEKYNEIIERLLFD